MKNYESGRSLTEILGYLAVAGAITVGAIATFNSIKTNQTRIVACDDITEIAKNTKIMCGARRDYNSFGNLMDFLLESDVIHDVMVGKKWPVSVEPVMDGETFKISLSEVSMGDCDYFALHHFDWAQSVIVNDVENGECINGDNVVGFVVK